MFDTIKKKFEYIDIDDFVPCDAYSNKPVFSKLQGEMWPLLLEKAFAKFRGSYANIEGGLPIDALKTLTGYEGLHISSRSTVFDDKFFQRLQLYHDRHCLMAAGSIGKDETRDLGRNSVVGSIVGGHAYSIRTIIILIILYYFWH